MGAACRIAAHLRSRPRLLIFFVSLFIYNANLRPIAAGDSVPAALFPFAAVVDHAITFDRYQPYCAANIAPKTYFFRSGRDGHAYSLYPIALPLLLTPIYAPFILASGARDWPTERIVSVALCAEKVAASLIASLSVVLLFGLLRRLVAEPCALILTVVFAFGTETWMISSQALWQHGASALALTASLDSLLLATGERRLKQLALAGLFAGLSVAIRPTNAPFLLSSYAVLLAFARRDARAVLAYTVRPLVIGALVAGYNHAAFGDLRGGYAIPIAMDHAIEHALKTNVLEGVANLLVSPSRGLFVYCPVLIFSVFGLFVWCRSRDRLCPPVYLVAAATSVVHLLAFAMWSLWWGGYTYGPRYFTDLGPCLVLLMAPGMRVVLGRFALRTLFGLALAASIAVQALGAFCYPNGDWNGLPAPVETHLDRLWDWRDNQIRRTFSAGIVRDPLACLRRALTPTQAELNSRFESRPRRLFQLEGDWTTRSTFEGVVPSTADGLVRLTASDDDPRVFLPPFDFPEHARLMLRVDITAPADTVVQVFFATVDEPGYSETHSVRAALKKGRNRVSLELPQLDFAGRLRFDPGTLPGDYTLHSFELRY